MTLDMHPLQEPSAAFFEVNFIDGYPHIHLHFLTDDDEYRQNGFGTVEIVCHGCGASLLVKYDESASNAARVKAREDFAKSHFGCSNRGYEQSCPDYRSSFQIVDLRRSAARTAKGEKSRRSDRQVAARTAKPVAKKRSVEPSLAADSPLRDYQTEKSGPGRKVRVDRALESALEIAGDGDFGGALSGLVVPLRDAVFKKEVPANGTFHAESGTAGVTWTSVRGRLYTISFFSLGERRGGPRAPGTVSTWMPLGRADSPSSDRLPSRRAPAKHGAGSGQRRGARRSGSSKSPSGSPRRRRRE